ncbi:MAG: response regulator transcription factor [Dehalococcoidales bacterium]|jgi:two-component system KDP operon response regulator KdpE
MNIKGKILIIDDDAEYAKLAQTWLQKAGYEVLVSVDGAEGMRRVFSTRPNLVLLDAMMPKMDGWEVCRRIREMSDIPVLMVTVRADKNDRIKGFGLGADDYIPKPVEFSELIARVQAVLRRTANDTFSTEKSSFHNGELEIDWQSRQVWVRGKRVKLSPTEFRVLACLIKNRGWIVTHDQLLEKGWGPNYIGDNSFVKLYIRYLRQKIEANPHNPQLILTERGVGYRFAFNNDELEHITGDQQDDKTPSFS